jgi:hypothetical protein
MERLTLEVAVEDHQVVLEYQSLKVHQVDQA